MKLALTDSSYRKKTDNHELEHNERLGTLGDAVLRLAISSIIYPDKLQNISEKRQKYESDKILVTAIGRHYDILKRLNYDDEDDNKGIGYEWKDDKEDAHRKKYIATAMEACLGAFYMDRGESIAEAKNVVKRWMDLVDECPETEDSNLREKQDREEATLLFRLDGSPEEPHATSAEFNTRLGIVNSGRNGHGARSAGRRELERGHDDLSG